MSTRETRGTGFPQLFTLVARGRRHAALDREQPLVKIELSDR
jgi:hypothetical protein